MDREGLRKAIAAGETFDFFLFYGHRQKSRGRPDASCLSQWFDASFVVNGERYVTAEHWMMVKKAELFDDDEMRTKILAAEEPGAAKALGRKVRGFDGARWEEHRFDIVVAGNVEKFSQNSRLGDFLRHTGRRVLVEAAPRDRIWGIGLGAANPAAKDPSRWRGLNLLGFALMEVRSKLLAGSAAQ
ncbi:MAG: NADAR family protein [Myxococcota bacterium]